MKDIIYIGCDSAGYDMKLTVMNYLERKGFLFNDCGSGAELSRYPYYAARVCGAISKGEAKRGILICGSGIGISIAANKFRGVRAALCNSTFMAKLTREHNDSNVLCMGGKMTGEWEANDIAHTWLTTHYDGGFHQPSLDLITESENYMMNGKVWSADPIAPSFDELGEKEINL